MTHVFSHSEGLRIACEMEKRGEAFYRRAAKLTTSDAAHALLVSLAEDECRHLREFERLYQRCLADGNQNEPYDDETNAYLSAVAADIVFPGGLMAVRRGFDSPDAVLEYAIQSEKDSVLFYTELAMRSRNADSRDIFSEIARQERHHMMRLQERRMQEA